jgi:pilus assembly protein CpaE
MGITTLMQERRSGRLRVRLAADSEEVRGEVKDALAQAAEPILEVADAGLSTQPDIDGDPPSADLVMVVFNGNEDASLRYVQAETASAPRPAVVALVHDRSPELQRRVLRAGADDLLFLPLVPDDITRILVKVAERRRLRARATGGAIWSLVSGVGGAGATSLTANLAIALRRDPNRRVAVVDLDLQSSCLAVALNVEPERTIMNLADGDKELDSIQLETALTKHAASGVYLLAAPAQIEESEAVSADLIGSVLELMQELFDVVLVDCGSHLDERMVAVWERSKHLLYVIDQSLAGARAACRFQELIERLAPADVTPKYVVNRYSPNSLINGQDMTRALGGQVFARLPRDEEAAREAEFRGRDLWQVAPSSALARAIGELAQRMLRGDETAVGTQGRLLDRVLTLVGARPARLSHETA